PRALARGDVHELDGSLVVRHLKGELEGLAVREHGRALEGLALLDLHVAGALDGLRGGAVGDHDLLRELLGLALVDDLAAAAREHEGAHADHGHGDTSETQHPRLLSIAAGRGTLVEQAAPHHLYNNHNTIKNTKLI